MKANPEIIRAARAKITPEGAWTQGAYARDGNGFRCLETDRSAVCWCSEGAIFAVGGGVAELDALENYICHWLVSWNDDPSRTHAEVLAAMDGCADALEKGEFRWNEQV